MRKLFSLIATIAVVLSVMAQDDKPVQKLIVHMRDGQRLEFLLDDEPVTRFEPGKLVLQTSKQSPVMYLIENVQRYTHEGIAEGLESPVVAPGNILVRQNNEAVAIDGLPDNANVAVYTPDGRLLISCKAVGGQTTLLSLKDLPQGNYIIHAGSASFKFVRQ